MVLNFNLFIRPGDNPLFHIFAVYIIKCFTRDIFVFSTISAYNDMLIVLTLSLGERMLKAVDFQPKGQMGLEIRFGIQLGETGRKHTN